MINPQTLELKNIDNCVVWSDHNRDNDEFKELRYVNLISENNELNNAISNKKISDIDNAESLILSYEDGANHEIPSAQCSDADDDVNFVQIDEDEEGEWMTNSPVSSVEHETSNGHVLPTLDKTTFGQVCISNSNHVRVGNTTLYKGPVTIKQFVYTQSTLPEIEEFTNNKRSSDVNPNDGNNVINNSTTPIFPAPSEYDRVIKWLWTWRCAAILSIVALVLVTIIVVVSVMIARNNTLSPLGPAIDPDDILTEDVRIIKRKEWGAQPPTIPASPLVILPAPYVIISHTASEPCTTQAECIQRVRTAQTMHIEGNGWDDIGYNFLVGGDGLAYRGRGWDVEGAHTFNYNKKSIGISCIGTFNNVSPPKRQLAALERLIEAGVKNGKIAKDYKLLGHRQLTETLSPGERLYRIIQKWPHWATKP